QSWRCGGCLPPTPIRPAMPVPVPPPQARQPASSTSNTCALSLRPAGPQNQPMTILSDDPRAKGQGATASTIAGAVLQGPAIRDAPILGIRPPPLARA